MKLTPHNLLRSFLNYCSNKIGCQLYSKAEINNLIETNFNERARVYFDEKDSNNFNSAFQRLVRNSKEIKTVIDIGASNGCWSERCKLFYPDANYLLIEAQSVHEPELKIFCGNNPKAEYRIAAAGATEGEIYFHTADPFGGIASDHPFPDNNVTVPLITIDLEVQRRNLEGPFLIKMDTHGYEVPILLGSQQTMNLADALVIECYNFNIAKECLLFQEIITKLHAAGFRVSDIFDLLRRNVDGVFWQADFIFLSNRHKMLDIHQFDYD